MAKAEADIARLTDALSHGRQREALWALMDCSVTIFHIGDWIRATHTDHRKAASDLAARSSWIRMARDICHAAKHGDLKWKAVDADVHGAVLAGLEYKIDKEASEAVDRIIALHNDGVRYDVVELLHHAVADWREFLREKGI